jgi:cell shape-determining protein MreC
MIKQKSVGRNWSLLYRKIYGAKIKKLTERNENLYNENQKLKKRLMKHEGQRRFYYLNEKASA